jgi:hypothetical protein
MRNLILLCVLFLAGCAGTVKPPVTDNYSALTATPQIQLTPSVAEFPKARVVTAGGIQYMAFTAEEGDKILAYRNASKNNREALGHIVGALNNTLAERNIMVETLKLEEARKNAMAEAYAEAENGRRYEQQTRLIETTLYKALLVILGIAAL